MANIRKSFNFRNGVQVDDDNFIVNANGLVGIGTSIPREFLDVYGTAKITGLVTTTNLAVTGVSTFYSDVKIGSGITFNSSTGEARATTFYGSAAGLTEIFAIAVDGWYVNAGNISTTSNVGVGTDIPNYSLQVGLDPLTGNGLSIDAETGNVNTTGIITATELIGIGSIITDLNASAIASGTLDNERLPQDISVSGIVTAYSFTGFGTDLQGINATNITNGTLDNERLPQNINISGIITANTGIITSIESINLNNTGVSTLGIASASQLLISGVTTSTGGFVGNVTGTASTALSLNGSPSITVSNVTSSNINNAGIITSSNINNAGIITSSGIISQSSFTGISTVSTRLYAESIGVGTDSPSSDIHIRRSSQSRLQVTSDTAEAIVAIGRSTDLNGSNGALIFGNTAGIYPYSDSRTLDIVNYAVGNLNHYLHYGPVGVGTGNFNWIYAPDSTNPLMSLTYQGNLGLGITNPTSQLEVLGNITASSLSLSESLSAIGAGTSTSVRTLYILNGKSGFLDGNGNPIIEEGGDENVYATSGVSTFFDIEVANNGIFNQRIGIGNTNPLGDLHIGDYVNNIDSSILIDSNGIGIGTDDLSTFGAAFYALDFFAIFGAVGIGTTAVVSFVADPEDPEILSIDGDPDLIFVVNGNTKVSGIVTATSFIGDGSGLSGVSTFFGDYNDLTNKPWNQTSAGIHTLSNVGIGTTNPTSALTVSGNVLVSGVSTFAGITTVTGPTLFAKQLNASGTSTFGDQSTFNNSIILNGVNSNLAGSQRIILSGGEGGDTTLYNGGTAFSSFIFNSIQGGSTIEVGRLNGSGLLNLPLSQGGINVVGVSTFGNDISVGVSTAHGLILTSPNGTRYRLIVNNAGALSTVEV